MLTTRQRGHVFGALAILFVLLSFVIWKYMSSGPKPPSELQIQVTDFKSEGLISSHAITIPKGSWYDTGIWVGPWRQVFVYNPDNEPKQPFELKIGNLSRAAVLGDNNKFKNWLYTADDYTRPGSYVSYIVNQAKIYLKVSDDATVEKLKINLNIWTVNEDLKKKILAVKGEEGSSVWETLIWIVFGCATLFGMGTLAVFLLDKWNERSLVRDRRK